MSDSRCPRTRTRTLVSSAFPSIKHTSRDNGMAFDYVLLKRVLRELCDQLDQRVLLPERSSREDGASGFRTEGES